MYSNPHVLRGISRIINRYCEQNNFPKKCVANCEIYGPNKKYYENYDLFLFDLQNSNKKNIYIKVCGYDIKNIQKSIRITNKNIPPYSIDFYDYLLLFPNEFSSNIAHSNFQSYVFENHELLSRDIIFLPSNYIIRKNLLPEKIKVSEIIINPLYFEIILYDMLNK